MLFWEWFEKASQVDQNRLLKGTYVLERWLWYDSEEYTRRQAGRPAASSCHSLGETLMLKAYK